MDQSINAISCLVTLVLLINNANLAVSSNEKHHSTFNSDQLIKPNRRPTHFLEPQIEANRNYVNIAQHQRSPLTNLNNNGINSAYWPNSNEKFMTSSDRQSGSFGGGEFNNHDNHFATNSAPNSQPITVDVSSTDAQNYDWLFKLQQQEQEFNSMQQHQTESSSIHNQSTSTTSSNKNDNNNLSDTTTEQSNNILPASNENAIQQNAEHNQKILNDNNKININNHSLVMTMAYKPNANQASPSEPPTQTPEFFFSATERFPNHERSPNAWWALGFGRQYEIANNLTTDDYLDYCAKSDVLITNKQRALCRSHWKVMQIVARGLRMAIEECQYRFASNRWNCSLGNTSFELEHNLSPNSHLLDRQNSRGNNQIQRRSATPDNTIQSSPQPVFGDVMKYPNRERSFLNAIFAAGLAHAMTKACSAGELPEECSCDKKIRSRSNKGKIEWVACSDDIDFGSRFSRDFTDDTELIASSYDSTSSSPNSLLDGHSNPMINTHNYEVGRRVFKSATDITCTCQSQSSLLDPNLPAGPMQTGNGVGVGLCATKRCWKHLAPFSDIGDELMKRYERATHVQPSNKDPHKLRPVRRGVRRPKRKDLVFIEESPNYCDPDNRLGILGTQGRHCNSTSSGPDSCSILCCGRGYQLVTEKVEENCNCQFVYCCKIVCDKCERQISYDICN